MHIKFLLCGRLIGFGTTQSEFFLVVAIADVLHVVIVVVFLLSVIIIIIISCLKMLFLVCSLGKKP